MSDLLTLQRRMVNAVMQPLTSSGGMRKQSERFGEMSAEAEAYVKPNDRLSSFDRLQIYNQQYWLRVLASLEEDFPGVKAIVGTKRFHALSTAYLVACPSQSFTLRNLGSRMPVWLRDNRKWLEPYPAWVRSMVDLEWAHIAAFDAAELPVIDPQELAQASVGEAHLHLQPYIQLLELEKPADELLLRIQKNPRASVTRELAAQRSRKKIFLAVHRHEYSVHYKRLEAWQFRLLKAIRDGHTLQDSLEVAFDNSKQSAAGVAHEVEKSFGLWMSLGWFCRPQANEAPSQGHPSR